MAGRRRHFGIVTFYIVGGLLLLGLAVYPAYFFVFQFPSALATVDPNLERATKWAALSGLANPLFTIIMVLLVFQERFSRKTTRRDDSRQTHFLQMANRIPDLVDATYLRQCEEQIRAGLSEAECGATFALTMGVDAKQEIVDLISNAIKHFKLILQPDVKSLVLSLAQIAEEANSEQADLFRKTIRGLTPRALCGWILVDALLRKNLGLLTAARTLEIDSVAVDSFLFFHPKPRKLEDLSAALDLLHRN